MFVNGPTGLDLAAIVDPAIRRAWIQSVGPVTFSDTTNHGVLFQNNVKALFGTSSPQSSIYQDGTDLVIQPQEVGSTAVVKFGASSDKNIQLNKIGLGTTAVSALNWIAFNQTASTGRGALSFSLIYTGSGTLLANVAHSLTHQGTGASGTIIGFNGSMIKDQDQSGTAHYYGFKHTIATANTRSITQGTSNFYGVHIDNTGVGTANSGGTVRQYGIFINALGTYSGVATYDKWGILSSEDVQINDDKYLIFGGTTTTKATNRMRWNTGTSSIDTEVNATVEKSLATSLETYKDGLNVAVGSSTGTKWATATTQKQAWWNSTPIVQPANTVAIDTLLVNTGLRATGGVALFDTDVKAGVVGKGYYVKEGTNATMGVATMVAGTVVVNTTKVTATSRIILTPQNASGAAGSVSVSARTAGTSFTILSTNVLDTRDVAWIIFEPA